MPYCPRCDMEFVEGVTVCTDCGGPLVSSREEAERLKKEEEEAAKEKFTKDLKAAAVREQAQAAQPERQTRAFSQVYVSKSEQLEDYRSSATAFYLVGGICWLIAALFFAGVLRLPFYGLSRWLILAVLAAFGAGCLFTAFRSSGRAKKIQGEAAEEKVVTDELIEWFLENFTAESLDADILNETSAHLSPEELALKRLSLIQDLIITNNDITDQSYVDELAEELYERLFDD